MFCIDEELEQDLATADTDNTDELKLANDMSDVNSDGDTYGRDEVLGTAEIRRPKDPRSKAKYNVISRLLLLYIS